MDEEVVPFEESSKYPKLKAITVELYNNVVELLERVNFADQPIFTTYNNTNWTALHYAAYMGNDEVVKALIERDEQFSDRRMYVNLNGASSGIYSHLIDLVDNNNWNALYYATFSNNVKTIEYLLEGKSIYDNGRSSGDRKHIKGFTNRREIEHVPKSELISREYKTGLNVLHIAAYNGHLEVIEFLLKKKPELNKLTVIESSLAISNNQEYDDEELEGYIESFEPNDFLPTIINTPIHYAACNNKAKIIESLHANNPSLIEQAANGCTAMHLASRYGGNKAIETLHKLAPKLININLNIEYLYEGTNAMQLAAQNGHYKTVKLLLSYDKDLASQGDEIYTNALHLAARGGHHKVVKLLLEHDAELV